MLVLNTFNLFSIVLDRVLNFIYNKFQKSLENVGLGFGKMTLTVTILVYFNS